MKQLQSSAISVPTVRRGAISRGCLIGLAVVVGGVLLLGLVFGGAYNTLVTGQERVEAKWSDVENHYKRRFDLIPNLVATVEGAAEFERGVLTDVTEARARVGQMRLPEGAPTDPAALERYEEAQRNLGGALSRLLVVAENYPQLKATQAFISLQDQLEGTENRIAVARTDYIEAVRVYNTDTRRFPKNLIAGLLGFEKVAQFDPPEEEMANPTVNFGDDE
jgi:LemA protein